MKTKHHILWENRIRVILTLILMILYTIAVVRIGSDMAWGKGMFIVFLGGCILIGFPFIAVFMGIWKNSSK